MEPKFDPTRQIRVLILEPGELESISARFTFVSLQQREAESSESWEAISYRWEHDTSQRSILLNGSPFRVAENVFKILHELQRPSVPRHLWIDAICIDQRNEKEKAAQIPLMRYIYQQASCVIIWLDVKGEEAAASMVVLASRWAEQKSRQSAISSDASNLSLAQAFALENPDVVWRAPFHDIVGLSWFERMWVVQEATLAGQLVVQLGGEEIAWDTFAIAALRYMSLETASSALRNDCDGCYILCRTRSFSENIVAGLSMIHLILSLRKWLHLSNHPIPPSELVYLCRDRKATNPRDMIYGISALFDAKETRPSRPPFDVLEGEGVDEVYKRFTCWCIENEGNLDVLAQHRNEPARSGSSIPSWARDWSQGDPSAFQTTPTIFPGSRVNTSALAQPHRRAEVRRYRNTLMVRGFVFDTLGQGFSLMLPQYHDENRRLLQEWRQQIPDDPAANRILFGQEQPTEETLEELWERTVEKDKQASHLWRDGVNVGLPVRQLNNGEFRLPMLTTRGCLAMTFPYFAEKPRAKICYLVGGRGLFVLVPYDGNDSMFRLGCGDCFIDGFEDGKGLEICQALGLKEQLIVLV